MDNEIKTDPDLSTAIVAEMASRVESRIDKVEERLSQIEASIRVLHGDLRLIIEKYREHNTRITQLESSEAESLTMTPLPIKEGDQEW
jgi:DNA repair ATPase RecN